MITAQNGKGSRARKVDGERYRASKLWDKKEPQSERERSKKRDTRPLILRLLDALEEAAK
tara:strand:+ start:105 stop:284 length:180 start_codon:yes stop_codon:yes gene_type:complete